MGIVASEYDFRNNNSNNNSNNVGIMVNSYLKRMMTCTTWGSPGWYLVVGFDAIRTEGFAVDRAVIDDKRRELVPLHHAIPVDVYLHEELT